MNKLLEDKRNGSSKYSKCTGICEARESIYGMRRGLIILDSFLEGKEDILVMDCLWKL